MQVDGGISTWGSTLEGRSTSFSLVCLALLHCILIVSVAGCRTAGRDLRYGEPEAIRISEVVDEGDPARRASTRLVAQGLEADAVGRVEQAQGSYERAIQVDPTNPYAYLALARQRLDAADSGGAIELLDQAAALFEAEGLAGPRVDAHLIGLRGRALQAAGRRRDAALHLERARELAPTVWGDGYLGAEELR